MTLEECLEVKTARECYPPNQTDQRPIEGQLPKTGFNDDIAIMALGLVCMGVLICLIISVAAAVRRGKQS